MQMRNLIQIVENAGRDNVPPNDISYYMEEGCGIFAIALSQAIQGGSIGILSRRYGDMFSKSFPYEITHVFYSIDEHFYDAKGQRTLEAMAADFHMETSYDVKGPWSAADFRSRFMGNSDRKPLFGGSSNIKEALALIRRHPAFYSLTGITPVRDPTAPSL